MTPTDPRAQAAPLLDDAPVTDAAPAPSAPSNVQRLVSGLGQSIVGPANILRALSGLGLSLAGKVLAGVYGLVRSWIAPAEVDPEQAITLSDGAPSRPAGSRDRRAPGRDGGGSPRRPPSPARRWPRRGATRRAPPPPRAA